MDLISQHKVFHGGTYNTNRISMAAGLATGLALSSFGVVSAALAWGFGGAVRGTGQFTRGLFDSATHRMDPLARRAGYGLRRGVVRAAALASRRENQVKRSA